MDLDLDHVCPHSSTAWHLPPSFTHVRHFFLLESLVSLGYHFPTMRTIDSDVELHASPLDTPSRSNDAVCPTPDTELSTSDIAASKQTHQPERVWATAKVAELTQTEKVSLAA